jgi:hypothetical protein
MKDAEVRGLVLNELYGKRHNGGRMTLVKPENFLDNQFDGSVLFTILHQLADSNLIEWKPTHFGNGCVAFAAVRITGSGVDVVEGTVKSPITVILQQTNNIIDSKNIQIGGDNTQNIEQ